MTARTRTASWARTVGTALAVCLLAIAGAAAAGAALYKDSPALPPLLLTDSQIPSGLTLDPTSSGATGGGWVNRWITPNGDSWVGDAVFNSGSESNAAKTQRDVIRQLQGAGYQEFKVPGIDGAFGATGVDSADGVETSIVSFARGQLFLYVGVREAGISGGGNTAELSQQLATEQRDVVRTAYGADTAESLDIADAAGGIVGGFIGYLLVVSAWAYFRDPLRKRRGSPTYSPPTAFGNGGLVITVDEFATRLKRRAIMFVGLQLVAASLVLDALLPGLSWPQRIALVVGGLLASWLTLLYQHQPGRHGSRTMWGLAGERPVRVTLLFAQSLIWAAVGVLALTLYVLTKGEPGQSYLLGAMVCYFAAAGISRRAARRRAAVSARAALERDGRPMVVYLRAFGDDKLRMRAATLGRRSLIERLSLNQFDSFEQILVRHLTAIGPVVAVNPPGTDLAPLGAARETLSDETWRATVLSWLDRAALVVIGAPPKVPTEGLIWELQQIEDRQMWQRTLVVVPPVQDDEVRQRWHALATARADRWPFASPLPADPARVLALTRRDGSWVVLTGQQRTEWSYSATIRAVGELPVHPLPAPQLV